MKPVQPEERGPEVTFNVSFTPGMVARLLPFSLSLLQSPLVRLRVVSNGCSSSEVEMMRALATSEDRVSHHALPVAQTVEHGVVLNELFEAFPEPRFAIVDSDVIAGGDFMGPLQEVVPGRAGVFTAPAVWMTDEEGRGTAGRFALSGARRTLDDGTYLGNTFCAIYERDLLEPVWREAPRGFAVHHDYLLPDAIKASLAERGWRFRTYDTARLVNLLLLLAGLALEERPVPELHHVGGYSIREYYGPVAKLRQLGVLRSSGGGRWRRLADGLRTHFNFKLQPEDAGVRGPRQQRKALALAYVDELLDALLAGEPAPPAPETDSPQVNRRLAELVAAVESEYPKGLATLRQATRAPLPGAAAR
jgi:hypothetical protein